MSFFDFFGDNRRRKWEEYIRNKYPRSAPLYFQYDRNAYEYTEAQWEVFERAIEEEYSRIAKISARTRERLEEVENRRREEELNRRKEEERKKNIIEENKRKLARSIFISGVESWKRLSEGLRYHYFYNYPPMSDNAYGEGYTWNDRYLIWNFKNDPEKGCSEKRHNEVLDKVLPEISRFLEDSFGRDYLRYLTLVCIPASTEIKNQYRYKDFSLRLCLRTKMENGYDYIHYVKDGISKTKLNNDARVSVPPEIRIEDCFRGKFVLLFDDVITQGRTMLKYKNLLEQKGAIVVGGLALGRTTY